MFDEKRLALAKRSAAHNRSMLSHRSFVRYAYDHLTQNKLYVHWQNFLTGLRRLRTVTLILNISAAILTVLETGAWLLLSTALFLVILPLLFATALGILLLSIWESRRNRRKLTCAIVGKQVYVLFPTEQENGFLLQNAKELSERGTVLLISPYLLSAAGGLNERPRFYTTVRQEAPNIFSVRRYYFFRLRKRLLNKEKTAYCY